jgi:hypothetical protein
MKTEFSFDLINGDFLADDAKSILMSLIKDKINYHELELFSASERFGRDLPHSKRRIKQLNEAMIEMNTFLSSIENKDITFTISAKVDIIPVEKNKMNEVV